MQTLILTCEFDFHKELVAPDAITVFLFFFFLVYSFFCHLIYFSTAVASLSYSDKRSLLK